MITTPKKIPTLLALFILFFAIGAISVFVQQITSWRSMATPSEEPKNVLVTNISDTACKIIWQTVAPTSGGVILTSKTNAKITAFDERDITGKSNKYITHSASIKNLLPGTSYDVTILSNGKRFPTKGNPLTFVTGPTISAATTAGLEPAYGTVRMPDGKPASGGIVVLTLEDSQTVSTLITPSGSWLIPLTFIRTKDLSGYVPLKEHIMEMITVYYDSQKTESLTDTDNDAPVPDMTVGNSYDFRNQQSKIKTTNTLATTKQEGVLGTQALTNTPTPLPNEKIGGVSITTPVQNASIVSTRPLIQGAGIPGKTVTVTIGIQKPVSGKATVGANSLWSYTPAKPLAYGKQSVTITTVNDKGKSVALTTTFTVLKSGSQVLGDATPSATIEPTPEASTTAEPITAEPMPEPGSTLPTILLLIIGVGLVAGGVVFLR